MPKSLAGQMAALLGIALLIAQLANFALILNERQKLSRAQNEAPAVAAFARTAGDLAQADPAFRDAVIEDASRRGARFAVAPARGIAEEQRDPELEARLKRALDEAGVTATHIHAGRDIAREDRSPSKGGNSSTNASGRSRGDVQILQLEATTTDGQWLTGRMFTPRRDPLLAVRLGFATALLYLIVLGASVWIAIRIARPLRDLQRAADRFQGKAEPIVVEERGPDDIRLAITAFNAMNRRVVDLLDEKDHMLGAIGHDLRTPLASLRIRIESMEPEEDRAAAVAKIEEMTAMLEDILVLARSGRAREAGRTTDLTAFAEALVDDYQDLGQPVTFAPSPRAVATVQADLLRRALRNLIDNAVHYGGSATVSVEAIGDEIAIKVTDSGPGIADDEIEKVLRPFYRIEGSRNRETGGSGLGLAIARNIAEQHGGTLRLKQNAGGGLIAAIIVPKG